MVNTEVKKEKAIEAVKAGFAKISMDTKPKDVIAVAAKLDVSPKTIERYLKGDVRILTTGKDILVALRKQVISRQQSAAA